MCPSPPHMSTHTQTHKMYSCTHLTRHAEVCVQVVFGLQIMHFKLIYSTLHYIVDIKEICKFISIKNKDASASHSKDSFTGGKWHS